MTRKWFDGTILVVGLFLVAWGGLVKPWSQKKLNQGADGVTGAVAETVSVVA